MAKKKRTGRKKARKKNEQDYSSLPIPSLASQALQQVEKENFSKGIELYRFLVKREPNEKKWLDLLASTYDSRIKQLAAKGMVKEALAILNNKGKYLVESSDSYTRLRLLLNSGEHKQAAELLKKTSGDLERKQRQMVESFFAAQLIAGKRDLLPLLPASSGLVAHYPLISQALRFWNENKPEEMAQALRAIPFTSPFKPLRLILKGLVTQESGLESEAQKIFEKIEPNSPFYHLASLLSIRGHSDKVTDTLSHMQEFGIDISPKHLGISTKTVNHFSRLKKVIDDPNKLFQYLANNRKMLGEELTRKICFKMLPLTPNNMKNYQRFFGLPSDFEMARIVSLSCEQDGNLEDAAIYWEKTCSILKSPENNLAKAIIHRHTSKLLQKSEYEIDGLDEIDELEKSLHYDPSHKPTHIWLLNFFRSNKKKHRSLLNRALKYLPEDVDILLIAVEDAIFRNAHKKASTIADKILRIDPINSKARDLIIKAHLNHGRKLMGSSKYGLAEKEFTAALARERAGSRSHCSLVCLSILRLRQKDKKAADELLDQALNKGANIPALRIRISAEARAAKLPNVQIKEFDKDLQALRQLTVTTDDLFAIIREIKESEIKNKKIIVKLFEVATGFVTKAAKLIYGEKEFISICTFFHQYEMLKPLTQFARNGRKEYPDNPWLIYYHLYCLSGGGKKMLNHQRIRELNLAGEIAMTGGDFELGKLLSQLLYMVEPEQNISPQVLRGLIGNPFDLDVDAFLDELDHYLEDDDEDESPQLPLPFPRMPR